MPYLCDRCGEMMPNWWTERICDRCQREDRLKARLAELEAENKLLQSRLCSILGRLVSRSESYHDHDNKNKANLP